MIVKKVPRKQRRAANGAVRAHAAKLVKYIVDAREEDARALAEFEHDTYAHDLGHYAMGQAEKVVATLSKNFRRDDFGEQLIEMDELLAQVGSDMDLVDHWVLSWDGHDSPTVSEMFDAFDILERCLGVENCPSVTAIHGNTDNPHGHRAVLRIDPETGETNARPHNGWDIDAAHRALAVIAERYPEWQVTPDRLYDVSAGRLIHRKSSADVGKADDPGSWVPLRRTGILHTSTPSKNLLAKIDHQSLLYEEDTGFKSRKRVAIEEAVPVLLAAKDWTDAHAHLAKVGIGLEMAMNKSGANLVINGKTVKASISDSTSLAKLEKRWGAFQPPAAHVEITSFAPRLMFPADADRARYFAEKHAFTADLTQMIAEVRSADQDHEPSAPSATCDPSKLMRVAFPTYDEWLSGSTAPDPASVLTKAARVAGFAVDGASPPELRDVAGYEPRVTTNGVAYYKIGDLYSRPALFYAGGRIYVNDNEDASILAALRILAEQFPDCPLKPFGPPDFIAKVEKIAAAEGIPIEMPPLYEATAAQPKAPPVGSGPGGSAPLPDKAAPDPITPSKSVASPRTPAVPHDARTSGSAAAPPNPDGANQPNKVEVTDDHETNVSGEAARKGDVTPSNGREKIRQQPDPQQEAAKAAAAARAAQWGRR